MLLIIVSMQCHSRGGDLYSHRMFTKKEVSGFMLEGDSRYQPKGMKHKKQPILKGLAVDYGGASILLFQLIKKATYCLKVSVRVC